MSVNEGWEAWCPGGRFSSYSESIILQKITGAAGCFIKTE
jgi:hypothetical protein